MEICNVRGTAYTLPAFERVYTRFKEPYVKAQRKHFPSEAIRDPRVVFGCQALIMWGWFSLGGSDDRSVTVALSIISTVEHTPRGWERSNEKRRRLEGLH